MIEEEKMNIHETLDKIAPENEAVDLSDLATYAHGYLDAESKYRRMIEDGELVEVVRCKDCSHFMSEGCLVVRSNKFAFPNGFCYWGERRTDEQT